MSAARGGPPAKTGQTRAGEPLTGDVVTEELLLDQVGQPVMALDLDGRVIYWNRSSEQLYGRSRDDVLGRKFTDVALADGNPDTVRELSEAIAAGGSWSGEFRMRKSDGARLPVYAILSPVIGPNSQTVAVVGTSQDITKRQKADAGVRRLSHLMDLSGDAIICADLAGVITSWNAGAATMFGFTAAEAIGRTFELVTVRRGGAVRSDVLERLRGDQFVSGVESQWRRRDGSRVDVVLTVTSLFDDQGARTGSSVIARDVTDLNRLRDQAGRERDRLLEAQELAHVGNAEYDFATGTWWHSEEFGRLYDLDPAENVSVELLLTKTHPEDDEVLDAALRSIVSDAGPGRPLNQEVRVVHASGGIWWIHLRTRIFVDGHGNRLRAVITALDVTGRKNSDSLLTHQASHDALTGLPSRALLSEVLQELLNRRARRVVAMVLDVDRFKNVNDGLGHAAGDLILAELADRLRAAIRPGDIVARFGGDEFVIVCQDLRVTDAAAVAARLQAALKPAIDVNGRQIVLNASIGIAPAGPGDSAETVLRAADIAMYRAKASGGDGIAMREFTERNSSADRLDLESDLRSALERNELRVFYQPVIDVETGAPIGCEALLRWQHPVRGLLEPAQFIGLAEETGLIVPIGSWVLNDALRQVQQWRNELPLARDFTISVNVSGRQLASPGFLDTVRNTLHAAYMDPAAVILELTESVLMNQTETMTSVIQGLHGLGVGLAIDDFGTGYSSLSYLRWLSANNLKIDRSFVTELGTGDSGASIVQLVVGMADMLNLGLIAEGVETAGQLAALRSLGVRHAQGYYWSKPLPAPEIPAWLEQQSRAIVPRDGADRRGTEMNVAKGTGDGAALVIRTWSEPGHEEPFRVRTTSSRSLREEPTVAYAKSREQVLSAVTEWLDRVDQSTGPDTPETIPPTPNRDLERPLHSG